MDINLFRKQFSNFIKKNSSDSYKLVDIVESNKKSKYLNRCFLEIINTKENNENNENKIYDKVISNNNNDDKVECITFNEHPDYWFEAYSRKNNPNSKNIKLNIYTIKTINANKFNNMIEICKEEFEEAAKKYRNKQIEIEKLTNNYNFSRTIV